MNVQRARLWRTVLVCVTLLASMPVLAGTFVRTHTADDTTSLDKRITAVVTVEYAVR